MDFLRQSLIRAFYSEVTLGLIWYPEITFGENLNIFCKQYAFFCQANRMMLIREKSPLRHCPFCGKGWFSIYTSCQMPVPLESCSLCKCVYSDSTSSDYQCYCPLLAQTQWRTEGKCCVKDCSRDMFFQVIYCYTVYSETMREWHCQQFETL